MALMLAACGGGSSANDGEQGEDGLATVRFGSVGGMTDAGVYLAQDRGYFAEQGIEVQRTKMAGSPDLTNALAAGELDVGGISLSVGLFNAVRQDIGIRLVGDKNSFQPKFSGARFMVRSELATGSKEEIIQRLKGRKVAVSAKISTSYRHVVRLLEKYGLNENSIELVEISYGNMAPSFANGSIDAAVVLEPYRSAIIEAGDAKEVSDLREVNEPGLSVVPIVYSEDFASETELGRAFMVAYMEGVRDYNDAYLSGDEQKIKAVNELVAQEADVDLEVVAAADPAGLDPNQAITADMFDGMQEFFVDQGFMDETVDMSDAVDTSFAEHARSELGTYEGPENG